MCWPRVNKFSLLWSILQKIVFWQPCYFASIEADSDYSKWQSYHPFFTPPVGRKPTFHGQQIETCCVLILAEQSTAWMKCLTIQLLDWSTFFSQMASMYMRWSVHNINILIEYVDMILRWLITVIFPHFSARHHAITIAVRHLKQFTFVLLAVAIG